MTIERLTVLYQQIADLTFEDCKKPGKCIRMGACCDAFYCALAIEYARDKYNVTLPKTEHPKYPLLGLDNKCTAPPHMRPMCSLHSCDISAVACFKNDPERTREYFKLLDEINSLELKSL